MRLSLSKTVLFFLVLVFAYLQYVLWFREEGIFNMVRLKRDLIHQVAQNEQLKQKNQELYDQVDRLRKDPEVTEGRARGELGMIKKGETFYQVIRDSK